MSVDPPCPKCGAPMYWRSGSELTGLHPEGAWECSNTRCWNMLTPGELAPNAPPSIEDEPCKHGWTGPWNSRPCGCGNRNTVPEEWTDPLEEQFNMPSGMQWGDPRNSSYAAPGAAPPAPSAWDDVPSVQGGNAARMERSRSWHADARLTASGTAGIPVQSPDRSGRYNTGGSGIERPVQGAPGDATADTATNPRSSAANERDATHWFVLGSPVSRRLRHDPKASNEPDAEVQPVQWVEHSASDGAGNSHSWILSGDASPVPPNPVNQAALTVNPVGHDAGDFADTGLGTPFIFDRGTNTVHLGPTGSYHQNIMGAVKNELVGPTYNGFHDGHTIDWYSPPQSWERDAIAEALSRHTGQPLVDGDEDFNLAKIRERVLAATRERAHANDQCSGDGAEQDQDGKADASSHASDEHRSSIHQCPTCGDPIKGVECPRCDWMAGPSDDATGNPTDQTRDLKRGIQANLFQTPEPWRPGVPGKGILDEFGKLHTWAGDTPHEMYKGGKPLYGSKAVFYIGPDGYIESYGNDMHPDALNEILRKHPGLTIDGGGEQDGGFNLAHRKTADDWDDQPFWTREKQDWSPGVPGKGWMGQNGVMTWRVGPSDRKPYHMDMRRHAEPQIGPLTRTFQIEPDGYVWDVGSRDPIKPEELSLIQQHDPRLHQDQDDAFNLSKVANDPNQPWFYHVAPTSARPSIMQKGLLGHLKEETQSPWEERRRQWIRSPELQSQPAGNYLFGDVDDARDYALGHPLGQTHDSLEDAMGDYWGDGIQIGNSGEAYATPSPPEGFEDWEPEDQDEWYDDAYGNPEPFDHNNPEHMEQLGHQGFDVWRVHPSAVTGSLLPDPEQALSDGGWLTPDQAIDQIREHAIGPPGYPEANPADPSNYNWQGWQDTDYYGSAPLRYYSPGPVSPESLQLHEWIPPWAKNQEEHMNRLEGFGDRILPQDSESYEREYPAPLTQVHPTSMPLAPPPQSLVSKALSGPEPSGRVIPSHRHWTALSGSEDGSQAA